MGYRLFVLGFSREGGDLKLQAGKSLSVKLSRAAPGVFFAVLGAAIVIYSVTRILQITQSSPGQSNGSTSASSSDAKGGTGDASQNTDVKLGGSAIDSAASAESLSHAGGGTTVNICDTCEDAHRVKSPKAQHPVNP
jgi:hypothetical protein